MRHIRRMLNEYPEFCSFSLSKQADHLIMYDDCWNNGYLLEKVSAVSLTKSAYHWGNGLISTPEFTPALLKKLMNNFNRQMLINYILRIFTHPAATLRFIRLILENQSNIISHFFTRHK